MDSNYKILDKQINLLKEKGLILKNEEYAKKILLRENYYHLISYDDIFINLKKNNYEKETYFEELYAIYNFDRELRNIIFDYINIVETNIKSHTAYLLTEKYNENNFFNRDNFNNDYMLDDKYFKLKEQINDNLQRNFKDNKSNLKKYKDKHNYLPPLLLIKVFTFGNITTLYSIMKEKDRKEIANHFSITPNELEEFLKVLNIVRNICAHGDILFNLKLNRDTYFKDYKYHRLLKINKTNGKYEYGVNDLLSILIIFKNILSKDNFKELFIQIENILIYIRNEIDDLSYNNLLKLMGFPNNFYDLLQNEEIKAFEKYKPTIIDTTNITLSDDNLKLAQIIAKNDHDIWGVTRKNEGWKYGIVRDEKLKTNPCFLPFEKLSKKEQEYDLNTATETLKVIEKLGYKIIKEEK